MALEITKFFTEIVVAPSFSVKAKSILKKKNLILIKIKNLRITRSFILNHLTSSSFRMRQQNITKPELVFKTLKKPNRDINDLIFAFTVAKHVPNAIVLEQT